MCFSMRSSELPSSQNDHIWWQIDMFGNEHEYQDLDNTFQSRGMYFLPSCTFCSLKLVLLGRTDNHTNKHIKKHTYSRLYYTAKITKKKNIFLLIYIPECCRMVETTPCS